VNQEIYMENGRFRWPFKGLDRVSPRVVTPDLLSRPLEKSRDQDQEFWTRSRDQDQDFMQRSRMSKPRTRCLLTTEHRMSYPVFIIPPPQFNAYCLRRRGRPPYFSWPFIGPITGHQDSVETIAGMK
jgi:hypothetical protein